METLHEWGIVMKGQRDSKWALLGGGWFPGCPPVNDTPDQRAWPMRFKTRREARMVAKAMERNRDCAWRFKSVRLTLTIEIK